MKVLMSILLLSVCSWNVLRAQNESSATQYEGSATSDQEPDGDEGTHLLIGPDELATTRSYQDDPLVLRQFDDGKWKEIVGGVDFTEDVPEEEKAQESDSTSETAAPSTPWAGPLLRVLSYVVLIGIVALLVYLVVRNLSFDLRIQRTAIDNEDLEKPVEDIETLDIQALLERATKDGNFRLAVRLYYLGLLRRLHEMGAIAWKKDKTNRDYLTELFSRNFFFDDIRQLTRSYESVWYGEHDLKPESFQDLSLRFQTLYQKINTGEKT